MMLAFEKQVPGSWITAKPVRWHWATLGGLFDRTLGLLGLGGIGTEVAKRALPFGMRVLARRRTEAPSPVEGVELVRSMTDLLAQSDHVVLAAPATTATRHLLNAEAFATVKPGAHIVNVARGALVDQDALRVALDDGHVAMASLDAVDPEPLPDGHWMYTHPRVRLSSHVSWSATESQARHIASFVDNLCRYVAGEKLHGVVDLEAGY
jgi:phosphoglycerate dehydrogenase-like enzyme